MQVDDVRHLPLFDGVSDEQLAALLDASEDRRCGPGETLWHGGEPAEFWWINVEGTIDLVRVVGGEETVLGQFAEPGRWAGGFRAWDQHGVYLATGRTTSDCRILQVPAEALRTLIADLPLVAHLAEGLFRTARNIEAGARQREALLTLGTLSAGLAHELNNPAAASARAVESLQGQLDAALEALGALASHGISAEQYVGLESLRRELVEAEVSLDALAVADLEDELSAWLSSHGVERDWVVAPVLAAVGAGPAWCDRALDLLGADAVATGIAWVSSTVAVRGLLGEIRESTRRVSELVASVKSYTQMDRASMQTIDVTDGIESTLVMLGHKLRGGITIERRFAEGLPPIQAYAGELNQVWTNLVDNAVDAMDGQGTLTVTTRAEGEHVVVEVGDTGPGMPPEVAARVFEAFFTTKDVGKGTGLGLDIARRIVVERHGGEIDVESRPGATTFRVALPLSRSRGAAPG